MSEKTTKSNDSSDELKMENLDPASQAVLAKMNGYDFSLYAVGFEAEASKELTTDEIMEGIATNKDTEIKVVKHGKAEFKRFVNYILNGLAISLKGKSKSKETKPKTAKPKDRGNEK